MGLAKGFIFANFDFSFNRRIDTSSFVEIFSGLSSWYQPPRMRNLEDTYERLQCGSYSFPIFWGYLICWGYLVGLKKALGAVYIFKLTTVEPVENDLEIKKF